MVSYMVITDVILTPLMDGCNIYRIPKIVSESFVAMCIATCDKIFVDVSSREVVEFVESIMNELGISESKMHELEEYNCDILKADYLFTYLTGIRQVIYWMPVDRIVVEVV